MSHTPKFVIKKNKIELNNDIIRVDLYEIFSDTNFPKINIISNEQ